MGLEIVGSRILAPRFGNTVYVWGSLIGIFIGSLALGYYLGGKLADAFPHKLPLGIVIGFAGIYLLALPLFSPVVTAWLDTNVGENHRLAVLSASIILFAWPSILLGCVSPYAVRLAAHDLARIGNIAGLLYAISTFGSLAGTLLTAFVLIPSIGIIFIVRLLGMTLIATTALLLVGRAWWKRPAAALPLFFVIIGTTLLYPKPSLDLGLKKNESLVFLKDSVYHRIAVIDRPIIAENKLPRATRARDDKLHGVRFLRFDNGLQSAIFLDKAEQRLITGPLQDVKIPDYPTAALYTEFFWLPFLWKSDARKVAFIGGGGCVIPRMFVEELPDLYADVVEIDPMVIKAAEEYFFLDPEKYRDDKGRSRLNTYAMDGRRFFATDKAQKEYDVIIIDAFSTAGQIPFHLTTQEYFSTVKDHLSDDGVVLVNLFTAAIGEQGKIFQHIFQTMSSVFNQIYVFPILGLYGKNDESLLEKSQNFIIVATNAKDRLTTAELMQRAQAYQVPLQIPIPSLLSHVQRNMSDHELKTIVQSDVKVLTDDWDPIDTWIHLRNPVRTEDIRDS